ncbi:PilW family protein [Variovorax sp. H27-G14]|uniref:PilW family protein n=1 Tax=Variovorax sp. H27-G14 TaxID=3111914 RepID=UPI0038FC546F
MRAAPRVAPRLHRPVRGFTLIELMISLAIGLLILAAGMAMYAGSSRGSLASQLETQMNEDAILALNLVQQQLKQAGYSRQVVPANGATVMNNYAGPAVRGCDGGFVDASLAFDRLTCTKGAGSDAIAIRYEATVDNTMPTAGTTPLPTNCVGNAISPVSDSQASPPPTVTAPRYALADNRYAITDAGTLPMLSCRGSEKKTAGNAIGDSQPLLSNVESMQILYGVASRPSAELAAAYDPMRHQIVKYLTATQLDAEPSTAVLPDLTEDRWARVLSVRVCLVMRSDQPLKDAPAGGALYKDCSNVDQTGTGGYLRRSYVTTVLLRNRVIVQ